MDVLGSPDLELEADLGVGVGLVGHVVCKMVVEVGFLGNVGVLVHAEEVDPDHNVGVAVLVVHESVGSLASMAVHMLVSCEQSVEAVVQEGGEDIDAVVDAVGAVDAVVEVDVSNAHESCGFQRPV